MIRFQTDSSQQVDSMLARLEAEGKYLAVLALLEKQLKSAPPDQKGSLLHRKAAALTLCGDEAGALIAMDSAQGGAFGKLPPAEKLPGARLRDAREEIVKQAAKRSVVVLNEAHHISRHRAFGLTLLPHLKRLGFTHFAAEAFGPLQAVQETVARRTVLRYTGLYTSDSVFAGYVQTAIDLGFTLVPYEIEEHERSRSREERVNIRETAQANHLYERVFKNNPRAKVLIHVGYSHATRSADTFEDGGKKFETLWMAGRLEKRLGTPLLTIDQTGGTEQGMLFLESARLRGVLERPELTKPSLVQKANGTFLAEGIGTDCDLTVFHPRQRLRSGRPDWLLAMPGRYAVPVPKSVQIPTKGRVLLQAFRVDAPRDAVDVDRCLLTAGAAMPVLVLPKGKYRLALQDESGNVTDAGRVAV